ncbi:hypothetical protein JFL43_20805 [Viridibacillus sp. YIM B01967]|uniref:Uncharacterized protein n=1 Tax=Viridibacillus soli TaxID=2798301 RepID=A0ABS1HCP1_9BACL|nr:hypothetical protein [Viridibacillus soli]MBK3497221.1 hypothetical protein [Viridibacillus soli]
MSILLIICMPLSYVSTFIPLYILKMVLIGCISHYNSLMASVYHIFAKIFSRKKYKIFLVEVNQTLIDFEEVTGLSEDECSGYIIQKYIKYLRKGAASNLNECTILLQDEELINQNKEMIYNLKSTKREMESIKYEIRRL